MNGPSAGRRAKAALILLGFGTGLLLGCQAGDRTPRGHVAFAFRVESTVAGEEGLRYFVRLADDADSPAAVVAVAPFEDSRTASVPAGDYRLAVGEHFCPDSGCGPDAPTPRARQRYVACGDVLRFAENQTVTLAVEGTAGALRCDVVGVTRRQ